MPASIVQSISGSQDTLVQTHAISLPSPAVAGHEIILAYVSASGVSVANIPTGFLEAANSRKEYTSGHYIWHKTAVGGEQTINVTQNLASTATWVIMEVSGIAGVGALVASAERGELADNGYYSTLNTFQPTAGERFVVGALSASSENATQITGVQNWTTDGFTPLATAYTTTVSQGIRVSQGVATQNKVFTNGETTLVGGGWNIATQYEVGLIVAFDVGTPDITPPSTPQNLRLTKRTKNTLSIAWDASTDNKAVKQYNLYIAGTQVATTTATNYVFANLNEITAYGVTVRAEDNAGNLSTTSSTLTATTLENNGKYAWTGTTKQLLGTRVYNPANDISALVPIPWEGGPAYWEQFSKTGQSGWENPSFFPIVAFFNGVSSNEEVIYDKSLGVNTYTGMDVNTPFNLFADNNVYFIGEKLNDSWPIDDHTVWIGRSTDDEVDGRYSPPSAGRDYLQSVIDNIGDDGRFKWGNYTQLVLLNDNPANNSDWEQYVNNYSDVVSIDMYWYTIPLVEYRDNYITSVKEDHRRTSSSYGKMMKSLRIRDSVDNKLQPIWNFIENINGGPAEGPWQRYIAPGELKGAVMSSIINEARGIVYFNQSFTGSIVTGGFIRYSQYADPNFEGRALINAFGEINNQIHRLATIINTQSYAYHFGALLDTMLKKVGGHIYIFAMIDGDGQPGSRTFTLPWGLTGTSVEVVEENRTITINSSRQFTDTFQYEYSYHIYKIAI